MNTVKEEATQLVQRLPDHATWDDLVYQIFVHQRAAADTRPETVRDREAPPAPEALPEGETFSQRWRGKFVPADRDDERYRALAKKYL